MLSRGIERGNEPLSICANGLRERSHATSLSLIDESIGSSQRLGLRIEIASLPCIKCAVANLAFPSQDLVRILSLGGAGRANQFFMVGNIVDRLSQPRPGDFSARRAELL